MPDNIAMQSIAYDIDVYKYKHGGEAPDKIFVSYPMYAQLLKEIRVDIGDRVIEKIYGIPLQPYDCKEAEYYFAEKGNIRRTLDEVNLIFKVNESSDGRLTPNKPIEKFPFHHCPSCDTVVSEHNKFCSKCGQKLDRSGEG